MKMDKDWLDRIPGNDFPGALSFLGNELGWNLTIHKTNNQWHLFGGDRLIITTETEGELESFVLGMALGLSVLPEHIIQEIQRIIRD